MQQHVLLAAPSGTTAYAWFWPHRSHLTIERALRDSRSNVFASKSGCTSIRRPADSTTARPQLGSCCVGDFPAANSTGTNRPDRPTDEALLLFLFQRCFFR